MKVTMIGTGYVGLVSGTCFAELGHHVTCIDVDHKKIEQLKQGESPIYEPGLSDLLERNIRQERLHFSVAYESIQQADATFIAVGTPSAASGEADLTYLKEACAQLAPLLKDDAIVVIKSTVPVGTNKLVQEIISQNTQVAVHVVNNPEFLKEGSAVADFLKPDRVVIGHKSEHAAQMMKELYEPLMLQGNPIFLMSNLSAEMTKYAANCFLATKISFINEIARLCDLTGADIEEVRQGITSDTRIGNKFLYPGIGYGGSCFPKDVKALIYTAKALGEEIGLVESVERVNEQQKLYLMDKIKRYFQGQLAGKTLSMWGVAFKPNTDDVRQAPSLAMAEALTELGARIHYFDPEAGDNFELVMTGLGLQEKTRRFSDMYQCLEGSDGLILATEWATFRAPDLGRVKELLNHPVIFDGRNLYKAATLKDHGLEYFGVGKAMG